MASDQLPLRAGQALGRYELLVPVAKGGMGQVWAARLCGARGFQKLVAVKTVLPALGDDQRIEHMLFEEARIASMIQHPNVVQTMELGEHFGALYLVMEWVDGEPLSYLLNACAPSGGLPIWVAVNLVAQTLRGLQAAHELRDGTGALLGVVHRDVSPHNVLISYTGVAKLVDFGIAKAMNQQSSSTTTGEIKGKFAYMAPEQILGAEVDQRADLFAAGIMLYSLTSGRHPFKNHESAGVLHSITSEEPAARPTLVVADYPLALEAVVMKSLEKRRDARWSSAEEMRLALESAVPEAVGAGSEARLRTFLRETLGERAGYKREALRRAELASGGQVKDGRSPSQIGVSAQSAGSLRAVSVDAIDEFEGPIVEVGSAPSLHSPGSAAPARNPRVRLATAICMAVGLLTALVLLHKPVTALRQGAVASTNTVDLSPARAPLETKLPSQAAPSESATATATATATASSRAPSLPVVAPRARPASARKRLPAPVDRPPTPPTDTTDLIAPDYAQ